MKAQISSSACAAGMIAIAVYAVPAFAADSMTINIVERATTDAVTDNGDKGDSNGDILTYANDLYDEANAVKVGSDNGWCIRTFKGVAWECAFTVALADGQLTAEGPFLDGKDSIWAVTGGTGKYMTKRGEMKLHARDPKGSEFDMKFTLAE